VIQRIANRFKKHPAGRPAGCFVSGAGEIRGGDGDFGFAAGEGSATLRACAFRYRW